jgi:hypothetical protein
VSTVIVEIRGRDLPGRRCGPDREGRMFENVHVGLRHRNGPVGLLPGDADAARWQLELTVRQNPDEELDFGGPYVYGGRGERALGLVWGTLDRDDSFDVFRAAKLRLSDVDSKLVQEALDGGKRLVCSLGLTDELGFPRCASVRPPNVEWSTAT